MIQHGSEDQMVAVSLGRQLIEHLQPGQAVIREGHGHVLMLEDREWHLEQLQALWQRGEDMDENALREDVKS